MYITKDKSNITKNVLKILTKRNFRRFPKNLIPEMEEKVNIGLNNKKLNIIILWGALKENVGEEERRTIEALARIKRELEKVIGLEAEFNFILMFVGDIHQAYGSGRELYEFDEYFKELEELTSNYSLKLERLSHYYVFENKDKVIQPILLKNFFIKIEDALIRKIEKPESYLKRIGDVNFEKIKKLREEEFNLVIENAKKYSKLEDKKQSAYFYLGIKEKIIEKIMEKFQNPVIFSLSKPELNNLFYNISGVRVYSIWPYKRGVGRVPWLEKNKLKTWKNDMQISNKMRTFYKLGLYGLLAIKLILSPLFLTITTEYSTLIVLKNNYKKKIDVSKKRKEDENRVKEIDEEIGRLLKIKKEVESNFPYNKREISILNNKLILLGMKKRELYYRSFLFEYL